MTRLDEILDRGLLTRAIDRSQSHDEIVHVAFMGDVGELLAELGTLYDGEIDSVEVDGAIDVWGYQSDAGDGEMVWRLNVRLTEAN